MWRQTVEEKWKCLWLVIRWLVLCDSLHAETTIGKLHVWEGVHNICSCAASFLCLCCALRVRAWILCNVSISLTWIALLMLDPQALRAEAERQRESLWNGAEFTSSSIKKKKKLLLNCWSLWLMICVGLP